MGAVRALFGVCLLGAYLNSASMWECDLEELAVQQSIETRDACVVSADCEIIKCGLSGLEEQRQLKAKHAGSFVALLQNPRSFDVYDADVYAWGMFDSRPQETDDPSSGYWAPRKRIIIHAEYNSIFTTGIVDSGAWTCVIPYDIGSTQLGYSVGAGEKPTEKGKTYAGLGTIYGYLRFVDLEIDRINYDNFRVIWAEEQEGEQKGKMQNILIGRRDLFYQF
eukprot:UN00499